MKNSGMSFGWEINGLWLISAIVWGLMVYWWWRSAKQTRGRKSWGLLLMVIGGGLNLGERMVRGYVSDYWRIPGTEIYNNINDWLIFVGIVMLIWQRMKKK